MHNLLINIPRVYKGVRKGHHLTPVHRVGYMYQFDEVNHRTHLISSQHRQAMGCLFGGCVRKFMCQRFWLRRSELKIYLTNEYRAISSTVYTIFNIHTVFLCINLLWMNNGSLCDDLRNELWGTYGYNVDHIEHAHGLSVLCFVLLWLYNDSLSSSRSPREEPRGTFEYSVYHT